MEYLKKKSGGCSSMNYAGVSDNYMLMDNAIAKTGGARKSKSSKGKKPKRRGGEPLLDKINMTEKELFSGGNPLNDRLGGGFRRRGGEPNKNRNDDMFGGALRRRGGDPPAAPPAASPVAPPNATGLFGMGSAITDVTKTLGLTSGGGKNNKEQDGGCGLRRCNKNKDERKKGGATGVELAPFISSLVILGLRAANDKALQSGITKKLGSLVSSSKKSKKSKSRRTKSVSN